MCVCTCTHTCMHAHSEKKCVLWRRTFIANSDFPETFRRERSHWGHPTHAWPCADEETEAIGGERARPGPVKLVASASERIQVSWRLLVSSRPCVGHVSQLLIIEHYVNHVASDIPSCVIRRPVCRPGKVIMCRDKAQLCFKQEITFSWSWKQQACLCLDGVPHLLSQAGVSCNVSCNSRILQLSSHQCLLVLSSCRLRVRSSCNLWISPSSPSSFWPRVLDWGLVLGTLEGFHLFFSQKEDWNRDSASGQCWPG